MDYFPRRALSAHRGELHPIKASTCRRGSWRSAQTRTAPEGPGDRRGPHSGLLYRTSVPSCAPSSISTLGYCCSAPAVPPRLPDLPCSSLLPCVGSLDPHRVPVLLQTPRADGVSRAPSRVPKVHAERAMRLQALGLWLLLGLLLILLLQPVRAPIPRAQDVSLGVVSSDPLAPGITGSL